MNSCAICTEMNQYWFHIRNLSHIIQSYTDLIKLGLLYNNIEITINNQKLIWIKIQCG